MLSIILAISLITSPDTTTIQSMQNISYRVFANDSSLYFQYKTNRNWTVPITIDKGNISEYAMTATSGDYVHIVWCKDGRVYYKINYVPITPQFIRDNKEPKWVYNVVVSPSFSEPAKDLSIFARNDFVFVDWKCPMENDSNNNELWRRGGLIIPGNLTCWYDPQNITEIPSSK